MKTIPSLFTAAMLCLCWSVPVASFTGCATVQSGQDLIVVRAEQSITVAWASLELFVKLDDANRAIWKERFPEAHKFAEHLREKVGTPPTQRGIAWIEAAVKAKNLYKKEPSTANRQKLVLELATLDTLNVEVQKSIDATQPE